ncbi:MAG: hypothetical protein Q7S51_02745 [Gallionellaceae bacterium]|nr:hypothetical protein [Gallionellaceae bacterium]
MAVWSERCRVLLCVAALSGCASYSTSFGVIERNLALQQYDVALQNIEQQSTVKHDRVLYLLNKGMVQRMQHDFAGSNQTLEAAKAEMERLYAASVSENTLSFLVNDATVSYAGDDYEQVLVHLYMALNYLELAQPDAARVEALQVDIKLREIGEKIPDSKFTEDAFSRYLTGLIYEEHGEWSDALIAYRKAYEAYQKYQKHYGLALPDMLKHDLLRLTQRQGLSDEAAQYQKKFDLTPPGKEIASQQGELVFILNNGLAPIKREKAISLFDPVSGIMARIALPYYESRFNNVASARIRVSGGQASGKQATSELMEDIDAIARQSLDARLPAITARSLARAVAKTTATRNMQRRNDNDAALDLLGAFAVQVAAIATERADTRSWLTLPANIQLARLSLPPGSYTVTVELRDKDGQVVSSKEYPGVTITQAHKTYLTQHWIPAQPAGRRRAK